MSDENIPPDIMEASREIAREFGRRFALMGPLGVVMPAARAIMAERNRCAQIAESNDHFPAEGEWIASLIRTPSTGEEQ